MHKPLGICSHAYIESDDPQFKQTKVVSFVLFHGKTITLLCKRFYFAYTREHKYPANKFLTENYCVKRICFLLVNIVPKHENICNKVKLHIFNSMVKLVNERNPSSPKKIN